MGVVYRAFDPQLQRPVAIKVIRSVGGPEQQEDVERFIREARMAARLRHAGIVSVHEAGQHGDRLFIAMDLVEGESLEALLRRAPPSAEESARIVSEVARALQHAHGLGVVHRDVKPGNILIDGEGRARLTDFGLARDTNQDSFAHITMTGFVVGTPAYMAPEQARGLVGDPKPTLDVWSLGAILYRGIAKKPPFDGESALAVMQKVVTEDPTPPRQIDASIPIDLETIALRCLEKEAERRYPTAEEVADEIDRFVAGRTIRARPPGAGERVARWSRRNRAALAVGVAGALLVCATAAIGGLLVRAARRHAADANARADRAGETASEAAGRADAARAEAEKARAAEESLREELEATRAAASASLDPGQLGDVLAKFGDETTRRSALSALGERADLLFEARRPQEAWACLAGALGGSPDETQTRLRLARARADSGRIAWTASPLSGGAVVDVAAGPRGQLVTAESDGVRFWNLQNGACLALVPLADGAATAVAISPAGDRLAAAAEVSGAIHIWELPARKRLAVLPGDGELVSSLGWIDADRLLAAGPARARLWNPSTRTITRELPIAPPGEATPCVTLGPESRRVAVGTSGPILVIDATDPEKKRSLRGHDVATTAVAIDPSSPRLISGDFHGHAVEWSLETGDRTGRRFDDEGSPVDAIAISADGWVATIRRDGILHTWGPAGQQGRFQPPLGGEPGNRLAWIDGGSALAVLTPRGELRIHEPASAAARFSRDGHGGMVITLAASSSFGMVASAAVDGSVVFREAGGGRTLGKGLYPAATPLLALGWLGDRRRVIAFADGRIISFAHTGGDRHEHRPPDTSGARFGVAVVSPSGYEAALARGSEVELVNLEKETSRRMTLGGPVVSMRCASQGSRAAALLGNGRVVVLDLVEGRGISTLSDGRLGGAKLVGIGPEGRVVTTLHADGRVGVWDVDARRVTAILEGRSVHRTPITALTIRAGVPGDTLVVTGDREGRIAFWPALGGPAHASMLASDTVITALVSVDDQAGGVIAADVRGGLRCFHPTRSDYLRYVARGDDPVTALGWTPDSRSFVAGDRMGRVVVSTPGEAAARWAGVVLAGQVDAVAIAADGQTVVAGGREGRLGLRRGSGEPRFATLGAPIRAVGISDDARRVVAATVDARGGRIVVLNAGDLTVTGTQGVPAGAPIALRPDGGLAAWPEPGRGRVVLWEPGGAPTPLALTRGPGGKSYGAALAPRGRTAALIRGRPARLVIQDRDDRSRDASWLPWGAHTVALPFAIGPGDRRHAAGVLFGRTLSLVDLRTGAEVERIDDLPDAVGALAWSRDGRRVVFAAGGTVAVVELGVLDEPAATLVAEARALTGLTAVVEGTRATLRLAAVDRLTGGR